MQDAHPEQPKRTTLKHLYAETTGDGAHQRTVQVHFARIDQRRKIMVEQRLRGMSYHQIGANAGISAASAREAIMRALEHVRKEIAGEPRYNRVGRKRVR